MTKLRTCLRSLRAKVASSTGETLVEALVAVLISAMSMLMLYTAVATCNSILTKNADTAAHYYDSLQVLASGSGTADASGSGMVDITGSGNASGDSGTVSVVYVANTLPGSDADVPMCVAYQVPTE